MASFFFESPWALLFVGIAVEAVLATILAQTGRGKYLIAMIVFGLVMLACLVVERMVVTDREAITNTLDVAVTAVRKNNLDGLLDCIAKSAKEPQDKSRMLMSVVEVEEAHISDLDIKVNRLMSPPNAEVQFLAVGKGKDRAGQFPYQGFAQRVSVQLQWQSNRWLITSYKLLDFDMKHL
jgi:hypothetical protein